MNNVGQGGPRQDNLRKRLQTVARERRHQLVRARQYYAQFVDRFRAKKLIRLEQESRVGRVVIF